MSRRYQVKVQTGRDSGYAPVRELRPGEVAAIAPAGRDS
jgi:hypothetical protein